jgi:hypothetical protein
MTNVNPKTFFTELKRRKAKLLSHTGASELPELHTIVTPERTESRLQGDKEAGMELHNSHRNQRHPAPG